MSPSSGRNLRPYAVSLLVAVFLTSFPGFGYGVDVAIYNGDDALEVPQDTLILNADDTSGDVKLQFGKTLNTYLLWDNANSYFTFNGNVNLSGNQLFDFRVENAAVATCDSSKKGRLYFDTDTSLTYVCNGTSWQQIDGAGSSSPGGSNTEIQFHDSGSFGGDADFTWDKTNNDLTLGGTDTGVSFAGITNEPTPPSSGNLSIYVKDVAGRMLPKWIGPAGLDTPFQPALFSNMIAMVLPRTGTTLTLWGLTNTAVGTVSTPNIASTNLRTSMRRITVTSATTANSASELRTANNLVWRGNASGLGGFFYNARFAAESTTANQRLFVGLLSATAATSTSQNISSLTNVLGVGWDSADTNMQFMANDASGTATKTDLGSNFPTNSATAVYELTMFAAPNGSEVKYRVKRLDTSVPDATGTISASGDLPASTTFLTRHEYMNNGGTAAAVILNVMRVYLESDN